jgi:hypothetical protein
MNSTAFRNRRATGIIAAVPHNPYLQVHSRRRRNRLRATGRVASLGRWLVPALAVVVLVPLVRPVFLSFLDLDRESWGAGLEGIAVRVGAVLIGVLALDVYTALIRSPDRPILDLHPVDPAQVVVFEVVRVAEERVWLLAVLALLLGPIGWEGSFGAWLAVMAVALGSFALGLTASAAMHLVAVEVAESPWWGPLLDMGRGVNQRAQAAFIYAPGVVLAGAGGLVILASWGVRQAWAGQPAALLLLTVPFAGAILVWIPVARLANRNWFRATAVLADIDARYAALGQREEERRVYLDWLVRFLPPLVGRYALKDLRHGWRSRRIWLTGPWIAGVAAALAGWSGAETAPGAALFLVTAAVWFFATVGVLMDRDDPAFLLEWLPPEPGPRWAARLLVLVLWAQGCLWFPGLAVLLRHGPAPAAWVVGVGLVSVVIAVPAAVLCSRSRSWGVWLYGPVAAVMVAASAAWVPQ